MLKAGRAVVFQCKRSTFKGPKKLPLLTLYTKDPCPLCDIAVEGLKPYTNQFTFETVDITEKVNKVWWEKYKFDIPVFHFEGKFLMWHKVDKEILEKALNEYHENQKLTSSK